MVTLTRLTGSVFALNSDLIERIDQTPDTVITLVDGTKYLVRESLADVIAAVLEFRASVISFAGTFDRTGESLHNHRSRLTAVPSPQSAPVAALPPSEA